MTQEIKKMLQKLNFQTNLDTRPGYFDSKIDL